MRTYPIEPKQVVYGDGSKPRGHFHYPSAHGKCFYCGKKLTGRQRHYCSRKCGHNYYAHFNWSSLREIILKRDRYKCLRCGSRDYLEVDHKVAIVNGGNFFDRENLQTLCRKCHGTKTGRDVRQKNRRNKQDLTKHKLTEFL